MEISSIRQPLCHIGDEKYQMLELNKRLESYLCHVKLLEEENQLLRGEIHALRKSRDTGRQRKAQEEALALVRRDVQTAWREKHCAELEVSNLLEEIESLNAQRQREKAAQSEAKRRLTESKKELEDEKRTQIWLRGKAAYLEEEILQQVQVHKEDMAALRASNAISKPIHIAPQHTQTFSLQGLGEEYTQRAAQAWQEAAARYQRQVEQLEDSLNQARAYMAQINNEKKDCQQQVQDLAKELDSTHAKRELLEKNLAQQRNGQNQELQHLQARVGALEAEKVNLGEQISELMVDRSNLLEMKMSLGLEVATYRALLDSESMRVNSHSTSKMNTRTVPVLEILNDSDKTGAVHNHISAVEALSKSQRTHPGYQTIPTSHHFNTPLTTAPRLITSSKAKLMTLSSSMTTTQSAPLKTPMKNHTNDEEEVSSSSMTTTQSAPLKTPKTNHTYEEEEVSSSSLTIIQSAPQETPMKNHTNEEVEISSALATTIHSAPQVTPKKNHTNDEEQIISYLMTTTQSAPQETPMKNHTNEEEEAKINGDALNQDGSPTTTLPNTATGVADHFSHEETYAEVSYAATVSASLLYPALDGIITAPEPIVSEHAEENMSKVHTENCTENVQLVSDKEALVSLEAGHLSSLPQTPETEESSGLHREDAKDSEDGEKEETEMSTEMAQISHAPMFAWEEDDTVVPEDKDVVSELELDSENISEKDTKELRDIAVHEHIRDEIVSKAFALPECELGENKLDSPLNSEDEFSHSEKESDILTWADVQNNPENLLEAESLECVPEVETAATEKSAQKQSSSSENETPSAWQLSQIEMPSQQLGNVASTENRSVAFTDLLSKDEGNTYEDQNAPHSEEWENSESQKEEQQDAVDNRSSGVDENVGHLHPTQDQDEIMGASPSSFRTLEDMTVEKEKALNMMDVLPDNVVNDESECREKENDPHSLKEDVWSTTFEMAATYEPKVPTETERDTYDTIHPNQSTDFVDVWEGLGNTVPANEKHGKEMDNSTAQLEEEEEEDDRLEDKEKIENTERACSGTEVQEDHDTDSEVQKDGKETETETEEKTLEETQEEKVSGRDEEDSRKEEDIITGEIFSNTEVECIVQDSTVPEIEPCTNVKHVKEKAELVMAAYDKDLLEDDQEKEEQSDEDESLNISASWRTDLGDVDSYAQENTLADTRPLIHYKSDEETEANTQASQAGVSEISDSEEEKERHEGLGFWSQNTSKRFDTMEDLSEEPEMGNTDDIVTVVEGIKVNVDETEPIQSASEDLLQSESEDAGQYDNTLDGNLADLTEKDFRSKNDESGYSKEETGQEEDKEQKLVEKQEEILPLPGWSESLPGDSREFNDNRSSGVDENTGCLPPTQDHDEIKGASQSIFSTLEDLEDMTMEEEKALDMADILQGNVVKDESESECKEKGNDPHSIKEDVWSTTKFEMAATYDTNVPTETERDTYDMIQPNQSTDFADVWGDLGNTSTDSGKEITAQPEEEEDDRLEDNEKKEDSENVCSNTEVQEDHDTDADGKETETETEEKTLEESKEEKVTGRDEEESKREEDIVPGDIFSNTTTEPEMSNTEDIDTAGVPQTVVEGNKESVDETEPVSEDLLQSESEEAGKYDNTLDGHLMDPAEKDFRSQNDESGHKEETEEDEDHKLLDEKQEEMSPLPGWSESIPGDSRELNEQQTLQPEQSNISEDDLTIMDDCIENRDVESITHINLEGDIGVKTYFDGLPLITDTSLPETSHKQALAEPCEQSPTETANSEVFPSETAMTKEEVFPKEEDDDQSNLSMLTHADFMDNLSQHSEQDSQPDSQINTVYSDLEESNSSDDESPNASQIGHVGMPSQQLDNVASTENDSVAFTDLPSRVEGDTYEDHNAPQTEEWEHSESQKEEQHDAADNRSSDVDENTGFLTQKQDQDEIPGATQSIFSTLEELKDVRVEEEEAINMMDVLQGYAVNDEAESKEKENDPHSFFSSSIKEVWSTTKFEMAATYDPNTETETERDTYDTIHPNQSTDFADVWGGLGNMPPTNGKPEKKMDQSEEEEEEEEEQNISQAKQLQSRERKDEEMKLVQTDDSNDEGDSWSSGEE